MTLPAGNQEGKSRIPSFKDLEVWKKAMKLVERVYALTRSYPPDERFGLTAESRKTSRSVPSNIAEGKMRYSQKEYHHFVSIAHGSPGELHTQILIGGGLGYLSVTDVESIEPEIEEVGRMLRGLMRSLA